MHSDSDDELYDSRAGYDDVRDSQTLNLNEALTNLDAERAILACLMKEESAWDRLTGLIHESDFSDHKHRRIFSTMRLLAEQNKSLDPISVSGALRDSDLFGKVGGQSYLMEIEETIFDVKKLLDYKELVRVTAIRRELVRVSQHIQTIATHPQDRTVEELLTESETKVLKVGEQRDDEEVFDRLKDRVDDAVRYIEKLAKQGGQVPGLESGFERLDELTSGFRDNDLIIVAARPSMGKTALTLNICTNILLNAEKPLLFFSLEQDREQLIRRMLSAVAGVSHGKLDRGEGLTTQDWQQLESARLSLSKVDFFIVDRPNITLEDMKSQIRRINRELRDQKDANNKLAMVVVDYLQLVKPSRDRSSRVIELGEVSRGLKALAKEFKIPVVSVAQLNRNVENRENKRPRMADLRDSGEIEQDADLILFIYRDEEYDEHSAQKGKAEIIIGKHRNGPRGDLTLDFQTHLMKFSNEGDTAYRAPVEYSQDKLATTSDVDDDEDLDDGKPPF
ncbi:MAG: replicative DNA helicase [Gammaproteobacteria bacterium]|nr:replicative DNA helicase [Gammaproteobacteria bacterium]MYF38834.1 replicative DNA helicase [Gammaproteobacteria bacterium]